MATCEKCWRDSAHERYLGDHRAYVRLVRQRGAEHKCTQEEQAGPGAGECGKCGRRAVHQYVKVCMWCGASEGE
jgi:hypothetical protein